MALCRTSASALALKFALGFTVPLLACNMEDVHRESCSLHFFSKAKAFLTKILLSVAPDYLSTETLNFYTFICVNAHNFGTPC